MIEKYTLPNGVRIVAEKLPHVRSVSVGIWVESGSRHEPEELNGISHFIEHMVFKGTKTRSASEIAYTMDSIGGQVNAFTTKEHTSFYLKTL
ncbi:MAG: insulinase family protein, partial [Bacillota bacterium]|nr:insulinase family protein [Bacillota bacterium]